jgi:hypothetical protein
MSNKVQWILQKWQTARATFLGLVVVLLLVTVLFILQVPQSVSAKASYNKFTSSMNIDSAEVEILREGLPGRKMHIADQDILGFIWEVVCKGTYPPRLSKNHNNQYFDIKVKQKNGDEYFILITARPGSSTLDCTFKDIRGGIINLSYDDTNNTLMSYFNVLN